MKAITCDHADCKSYYQSHPTACHDIEHQLKQRGWQVLSKSDGTHTHFCQAHKKPDPGPVEVDVAESDVA